MLAKTLLLLGLSERILQSRFDDHNDLRSRMHSRDKLRKPETPNLVHWSISGSSPYNHVQELKRQETEKQNNETKNNIHRLSHVLSTNDIVKRLVSANGRHLITSESAPGNAHPWSCPSETFWRDLGAEFNPRFVQDKRCSTRSCFFGHNHCVPMPYAFTVVRTVNGEEAVCNDPAHVTENTALEIINVTIGCSCR